MADAVRNQTDKELAKMEKHLASIFAEAEKDLIKKANDYLSKFEKLDEDKKSKVEEGKLTQKEYDEWRKNKLLYGEHWTRLISAVQNEMVNCNKTAIDYVNGKTAEIFAMNYNSIAEKIEESDVKGYSFEMVDAETVRQLATSGELMLPHKDLDEEKDKRWNAKQVNSQVLQGVLQGESIPKIAQRMANVCNNDKVAMVRTARTMITGAENSGRQAGMNKAADDGIIFWKMWIATSDERTRDSHNVLNGQVIPNDEKFVTINEEELEFPGDWRADGCEVYNCRCSLGSIIKGFNKKRLDEAIEEQQAEPETEERSELQDQNDEAFVLPAEIGEFIQNTFGKDKNFAQEDYDNMTRLLTENPTESKFFERYGLNVKWELAKSGVCHGKTSIEYKLNTVQGRSRFGTIFHEFGHCIDFNLSIDKFNLSEVQMLRDKRIIGNSQCRVSASSEFLEALQKDKEYILGLIHSDDTSKEVRKQLFYGSSGLQDLLSGIAGDDPNVRKKLRWAHDEKYYNRYYKMAYERYSVPDLKKFYKEIGIDIKNASELKERMRMYDTASEAFANMNEEYATRETDYMEKYCPNMWKLFTNIMEEYSNEN